MARQLAVTTQLKNANARIVELEKKLKEAESVKDKYYKSSREHEATLEQINQLLDAVPNSVPRTSEGENSWDRVTRTPMMRLAAWLAIRT